jgi:glycosyltransferase involved in cell wall biosynthesis
MAFDFYLSEMSVSDQHGGGLTMQRILGNELLQIPLFVHLGRFAAVHPIIAELKDRELELSTPWDSDLARRIIGRTRARAMRKKTWVVKSAAKNAARVLDGKFEQGRQLKVLVCPQGANSLYTLEALKQRRPVKYISWVMDDHLVQYVNGQWQYPGDTEAVFGRHLRGAQHVFVISTAMQQFYLERFGVNSTVLFGPADPLGDAKYITHTSGLIKIGYFGAVAPWQMDALAAVANALNGTSTQLDIYSGIEQLPQILQQPGVQLMARISPDLVLPTMQHYDAILLPMSFSEQKRHMSQFNIATKMSEYLASGVPILAVGPAYAAMIKYLKAHEAAIIVESADEAAIRQAFAQLHHQQLITTTLANAQKLVTNATGTAAMRGQWQAVVNKFLS